MIFLVYTFFQGLHFNFIPFLMKSLGSYTTKFKMGTAPMNAGVPGPWYKQFKQHRDLLKSACFQKAKLQFFILKCMTGSNP